jgi:hypothetical protein
MRQIPSLLLGSLTLALAAFSTVKYSADYDRQAAFVQYRTYDWLLPTADEQAALERVNPFLERRLQRADGRELADRGFVKSTEGDPDWWVSVYPLVPTRGDDSSGDSALTHSHGAYPRSRVNLSVGFAVGFGHPYWFGFGHPYFTYSYPYFGYPYSFAYGYPYFGFRYPYFGFRYPYFGFRYPYFGYPRYRWYPGFGVGYYSSAGYAFTVAVALGGLGPGTLVIDPIDAQTDELVWRGWAERALLEAPGPDRLTEYVDEVVGRIMKEFPPSSESV